MIEVNVSELGMVTAGGKVVFGKYAQITNNPENDGCINAVLRTSFRFPHPSNSSSFHFLFHSRMICYLLVSNHDLVLLDFLVLTQARREFIQAFLTWNIYLLLYSLYCPWQLDIRSSPGIFQFPFFLEETTCLGINGEIPDPGDLQQMLSPKSY